MLSLSENSFSLNYILSDAIVAIGSYMSVCNISIPEKVWFGTNTISRQLAVKGQSSRVHGAQTK